MSDGGKGSAPRPFSVSQEEWDNRWDNIFGKDKPKDESVTMQAPGTIGGAKVSFREDNTGTSKNEYYDVLTTEDALRSNDETREAIQHQK